MGGHSQPSIDSPYQFGIPDQNVDTQRRREEELQTERDVLREVCTMEKETSQRGTTRERTREGAMELYECLSSVKKGKFL